MKMVVVSTGLKIVVLYYFFKNVIVKKSILSVRITNKLTFIFKPLLASTYATK